MKNIELKHATKCYIIKYIVITFLLNLPNFANSSDLPSETHPCILYEEDDVEDIRDRLTREPYSNWWNTMQNMLSWIVNINFSNATELEKSRYSKMLAFAYVMTDSTLYAEKALEGLSLIDPNGNWGGSSNYYAHADPLTFYCETYDMLKGANYNFSGNENYIRNCIAEKANEFYNNFWIIFLYTNNWRLRYFAALGNAAFTLADHADAESWHDYAECQVRAMFTNYQSVGEGAWAEGPYYLQYSAKIYMPYMNVFHRLITGTDIINETSVKEVHNWNWKIRMPDGKRPNFEDSHLHYFYPHYIAPVSDSNAEIFQWDFLSVPYPDSLYAENYWIPDAICYYDDTLPQQEPDIEPTIYLPDAGNMIFRSGWGTNDIYLFLIGEHSEARINGQGHDHPDATSFLLAAYGEYLALDAGYVSWPHRNYVNNAYNHSLILVDGLGPPSPGSSSAGDADSYLIRFFDIGNLQFCADSTYYQNVHITRSILFVNKEYFLIRDRILSRDTHTYNWRLHGNGGATSGGNFILTDFKAKWSRDNAYLVAAVNSPVSMTYSTTIDTHSFAYEQVLTHNTYDAEFTGDSLDLLAVLYPQTSTAAEPTIETLPFPNGTAFKLDDGIVVSNGSGDQFILNQSVTGFPDVESNAKLAFCAFEDSIVSRFYIECAQYLNCAGIQYFQCDECIVFALDRVGNWWRGYNNSEGIYTISLYIGTVDPPVVNFNGTPIDVIYEDGIATFEIENTGELNITLPPEIPNNLRIAYSDGQVILTWDVIPNAISYNIYRSSEAYFNPTLELLIANTTNPIYIDDNPQEEKYFYVVTSLIE